MVSVSYNYALLIVRCWSCILLGFVELGLWVFLSLFGPRTASYYRDSSATNLDGGQWCIFMPHHLPMSCYDMLKGSMSCFLEILLGVSSMKLWYFYLFVWQFLLGSQVVEWIWHWIMLRWHCYVKRFTTFFFERVMLCLSFFMVCYEDLNLRSSLVMFTTKSLCQVCMFWHLWWWVVFVVSTSFKTLFATVGTFVWLEVTTVLLGTIPSCCRFLAIVEHARLLKCILFILGLYPYVICVLLCGSLGV